MVTRSIRPAGAHVGVGDQVRFKFGLSFATGRIVATRAPVKCPSETKYLVEFRRGGSDPLRVELSRAELELVNKAAA
jgi:hypothetical protein